MAVRLTTTTGDFEITMEGSPQLIPATATTASDPLVVVHSDRFFDPINLPTVYKGNTSKKVLRRPAVYILFCKDVPVYVGQSIKPLLRIENHMQQKEKLFDTFRILHCAKHRLLYWEGYLIYKLQPRYNKTGKTFKRNDVLATVREQRGRR